MRGGTLWLVVGVTLAVAAAVVGATSQSAGTPTASAGGPASPSTLMGTIHAADGKALDGITVSARASGQTFTTSVYTDDKGEYVFPSLPPGSYQVWAQAVGFATARANLTLAATPATVQALTLQPLKDFASQLTGTEWLDSLPEDTVDHRRMKQILRVNCADCHSMAVVLQNRFDEAGWRTILRTMEDTAYNGWAGNIDRPADMLGLRGQIVRHHRDELAKYLATMRGPGPSPLVFKPLPRPSGEAGRAVVTEYDVPIGERPNQLAWYNGSEWSEGPSTGMHGTVGLHDVVVDRAGTAWISESRESWETDRTLTKLDVKTGQATAVKLAGPDGKILFVEQIALDVKGNIWMHQNFARELIRLEPATETFTMFLQPRGMGIGGRGGLNNSTDSDSQGRIWINGLYGSVRFDPATEKWQLFQQNSPNNGTTYGVAADADDNGWWSEFYGDKVAKMDLKTGKVQELDMHDPAYDARKKLHTPADLEFYDSIGAETWGGGPAPYGNAPRRMASDKMGNTVWVPNWAGMNLAEIDIHTLKVTYHPLPIHGHPYHAFVDNQHNVWADIPMADSFVKWNPKAQQWTVYKLPSHGCGSRHSSFDDLRGEAWMPCDQSGKVARFQFRTADQIQAQKIAGALSR
jgi:streptogramin lyase